MSKNSNFCLWWNITTSQIWPAAWSKKLLLVLDTELRDENKRSCRRVRERKSCPALKALLASSWGMESRSCSPKLIHIIYLGLDVCKNGLKHWLASSHPSSRNPGLKEDKSWNYHVNMGYTRGANPRACIMIKQSEKPGQRQIRIEEWPNLEITQIYSGFGWVVTLLLRVLGQSWAK